ncbi:MAG: hypothetical protein IT184_03470 [Acidobacteria bacterium]|nr:hypothetical protein [Acidobacteriota bacterium]
MLRGNLSTRPFYNERAVTLAIGLVAVVVLALTAFNATELVRLAGERQRVQQLVDRDLTSAARIRETAIPAERDADRAVLSTLAAATSLANDLIDQRTFSWTAFFGLLERTLPVDVRLVEVSPRVEQGVFRVTMTVVARDLADLGAFVDALRETGSFREVAAIDQRANDDGTMGATVAAAYDPARGPRGESAAQGSGR